LELGNKWEGSIFPLRRDLRGKLKGNGRGGRFEAGKGEEKEGFNYNTPRD